MQYLFIPNGVTFVIIKLCVLVLVLLLWMFVNVHAVY
jgi:hypothetical protein